MKVNVIHGGRKERKENFIRQFQEQGIDFEIWDGLHDKNSIVRTINTSHKQIVEYAMFKRYEMVCIAEDDIDFTNPNGFNFYVQNTPPSFDVYLGGAYIPDFKNGKLYSWCGLHLYTVHQNFYETVLSVPENVHLDRALAGMGNFHLCDPMVAIQLNGYSSNTGKNENYDSLLKDKNLYNG